MINLEVYTPIGNVAVDMCAACIIHERSFGKPIKSITLNSIYWGVFNMWAILNYGVEITKKKYYLGDVEIKREIEKQNTILTVQYE